MKSVKTRAALTTICALLAAASVSETSQASAQPGPERVPVACPERAAVDSAPAAANDCYRVRRCTPRGCKWVYVCHFSAGVATETVEGGLRR